MTSAPNLTWYSVASSADGTKLVALAWQTNVIYTSTDSGANWVPNSIANNWWYCVASSADGAKLIAASQGGSSSGSGPIYTSTNSGNTWVSNNVANQEWLSVASSADGNELAAVAAGAIYTSVDSGQTWISNSVPIYYWSSVASSSDGNRLVAVAATGQVYIAQPSPPLISLKSFGTNLIVSWPLSASGFHLQQNANLKVGTWADLTNSPIVTNSLNQVTVAKTNGPTFYRLKNQ